MNRRPSFRVFGRGNGRGRPKSGFLRRVDLPTADDVAPVWEVPASSEDSAEEGGEEYADAGPSRGSAEPAAEIVVDEMAEGVGAEFEAGGLVPAAMAHGRTQPSGGCAYGRRSSGR